VVSERRFSINGGGKDVEAGGGREADEDEAKHLEDARKGLEMKRGKMNK
jgi:hypothetical protein